MVYDVYNCTKLYLIKDDKEKEIADIAISGPILKAGVHFFFPRANGWRIVGNDLILCVFRLSCRYFSAAWLMKSLTNCGQNRPLRYTSSAATFNYPLCQAGKIKRSVSPARGDLIPAPGSCHVPGLVRTEAGTSVNQIKFVALSWAPSDYSQE